MPVNTEMSMQQEQYLNIAARQIYTWNNSNKTNKRKRKKNRMKGRHIVNKMVVLLRNVVVFLNETYHQELIMAGVKQLRLKKQVKCAKKEKMKKKKMVACNLSRDCNFAGGVDCCQVLNTFIHVRK